MKGIFFSTVFLLFSVNLYGQILFTETFNVILDSGRSVQGAIVPDFKFQTQRQNLLEFENLADITVKLKDNAFTFANKFELSRFGEETLLSGGYVYGEYRKILNNKFVPEIFSQIHWAEARGMQWKYAGGVNARLRIKAEEKIGLFVGIGPFYEFERWSYEGVNDSTLIPLDKNKIETSNLKIGSYVSFKFVPLAKIFVDLSIYHQSRIDEIFSTPRLASSSKLIYSFTEHLGLALIYQNIYDFDPVVPIDKLFNRVIFSFNIAF